MRVTIQQRAAGWAGSHLLFGIRNSSLQLHLTQDEGYFAMRLAHQNAWVLRFAQDDIFL